MARESTGENINFEEKLWQTADNKQEVMNLCNILIYSTPKLMLGIIRVQN
jgi:hypothetical protein